MPLKHPFIMVVLRVLEIEIPLSALCISFCQQASKEEKKTWLGSLFHEKNKPPTSYRYSLPAFCVPSTNIQSLRAQRRWRAGSTRAELPCFIPWSWPGPVLMKFQKFTSFPISYHMVLNPMHIARDVVAFWLEEVGDTYSILWTKIPAALGLWIVLFSGIWPGKWLICAK